MSRDEFERRTLSVVVGKQKQETWFPYIIGSETMNGALVQRLGLVISRVLDKHYFCWG